MVNKIKNARPARLINDGTCPECGAKLPKPVLENREGGYSELVTYCSCGATYIS